MALLPFSLEANTGPGKPTTGGRRVLLIYNGDVAYDTQVAYSGTASFRSLLTSIGTYASSGFNFNVEYINVPEATNAGSTWATATNGIQDMASLPITGANYCLVLDLRFNNKNYAAGGGTAGAEGTNFVRGDTIIQEDVVTYQNYLATGGGLFILGDNYWDTSVSRADGFVSRMENMYRLFNAVASTGVGADSHGFRIGPAGPSAGTNNGTDNYSMISDFNNLSGITFNTWYSGYVINTSAGSGKPFAIMSGQPTQYVGLGWQGADLQAAYSTGRMAYWGDVSSLNEGWAGTGGDTNVRRYIENAIDFLYNDTCCTAPTGTCGVAGTVPDPADHPVIACFNGNANGWTGGTYSTGFNSSAGGGGSLAYNNGGGAFWSNYDMFVRNITAGDLTLYDQICFTIRNETNVAMTFEIKDQNFSPNLTANFGPVAASSTLTTCLPWTGGFGSSTQLKIRNVTASGQLGTVYLDDVQLVHSCGSKPKVADSTCCSPVTPTFTATPTRSATPTSTATFSFTRTATPTFTRSATPSVTPSATLTATPSVTRSVTSTPTHTPTVAQSPTFTFTATWSATPTATATRSATPSFTFSATLTATPTITATRTATPTVTDTPTLGPTQTFTSTRTATATFTASATLTATPTQTVTRTATPTVTDTPTLGPTQTFSATQTATATFSATATLTATRTITPTATDTAQYTPTATATYSATRSATPTFTDSATFTATPTVSFTATASSTATQSVTPSFSATPSSTPTESPSYTATATATATRTASPTPSVTPTATVSFTPSETAVPQPIRIKISIYNAAGELVRQLFEGSTQWMPLEVTLSESALPLGQPGAQVGVNLQSGKTNGSGSLAWDGLNDNGQAVTGGSYYYKIEFKDPFGQITTKNLGVTVIDSSPATYFQIFNSAGELVYQVDLTLSAPGASDVSVPGTAFSPNNDPSQASLPGQAASFTVQSSTGSPLVLNWDGRNLQGQVVDSGTYTVKISSQGPGGGGALVLKAMTVLRNGEGKSDGQPAWAQNPVGAEQDVLLTYTTGPLGLGRARARMYNVAGELVAQNDDTLGQGVLVLKAANLATGIYVVDYQYRDGIQAQARRILKICILR